LHSRLASIGEGLILCNNARARRARTARRKSDGQTGEMSMEIAGLPLSPLIALVAGVLILIMPRLLNYIVAIYLIIVGLLGIFPQLAG
jgi:hypothetical protein